MRPSLSRLDKQVARLLACAFMLFWAIPLAAGIWLKWGDVLVFTVWDGWAFLLVILFAIYEMVKSGRQIAEAL